MSSTPAHLRPADAPVSDREAEVAKLCAQDLPDKTIADRLGLSQKTVEAHLYNLRRKLKVRSKIGVAVWWVTHGKPAAQPPAEPAPPVQRSPKVYVRMSDYVEARGIG